MLRVIVDHIDYLERAIDALDVEIDRVIAPFTEARDRLDTISAAKPTRSVWRVRPIPCGHGATGDWVGLAASFDAVANLCDGRFPGSYVESATVGVSASSWLRSRSHR